jgi:hypothetical protein
MPVESEPDTCFLMHGPKAEIYSLVEGTDEVYNLLFNVTIIMNCF